MNKFEIPVLFICFNRLEIAKKSFKKIVELKPQKLYIACDGARETIKDEKEKVQKIRDEILRMITWSCEVRTLFQNKNLGCGKAVYTAISWLFEKEELGIILEDDCLVNNSFFKFMEEILIKYKNDERIGMIRGTNFIGEKIENSYTFTKFPGCWGWGTWKRAWKNMDLNLRMLETEHRKDIIQNMGYNEKITKNYWSYRLKLIKLGEVSAWDWQWYFTLSSQNQLSILPAKNLVINIGFGKNGTHTTGKIPENYKKIEELAFPLKHPQYIVSNFEIEKLIEKTNGSIVEKIKWRIPLKIIKIIKKILRG